MQTPPLSRAFALGLLASLAVAACDASAFTVAYTGEFLPGGFDFDRLDFNGPPETIGRLDLFPAAGAFAGEDYSHEYMIDLAAGRLHSVDVLTGIQTVIGDIATGDNQALGMHWDPTGERMLVIANDASCATSTLYSLDVSDASTIEIGSTPGCIIALAIDGDGHAFGIDQMADALVSIDTATGTATTIGPLGFHPRSLMGGFDFDPSNGLLYLFTANDSDGTAGMYLVDTAAGGVTLVTASTRPFFGLAFAQAVDSIFSSSFDP